MSVSGGNTDAIAFAGELMADADAGSAEALSIAAAEGLAHAPVAVLRLIDRGVSVDRLCISPSIEPEPGVERRFVKAALAALDAVPVAERPEPVFAQCRAALVKIEAALQR